MLIVAGSFTVCQSKTLSLCRCDVESKRGRIRRVPHDEAHCWFICRLAGRCRITRYAAVERHPYSFYTLLRWICCPVFAYSAFAAYEKNRVLWVWIFGVLAGLYNPIFRVHLDRTTWVGLNWFTVVVIAVAGVVFWLDKKRSTL